MIDPNDIPEEQREEKAAEYLYKSASKQKEAAEKLNETLKHTKNAFTDLLNSTPSEHYSEVAQTINQVNELLREAKKGKDIDKIVAKIKGLK